MTNPREIQRVHGNYLILQTRKIQMPRTRGITTKNVFRDLGIRLSVLLAIGPYCPLGHLVKLFDKQENSPFIQYILIVHRGPGIRTGPALRVTELEAMDK